MNIHLVSPVTLKFFLVPAWCGLIMGMLMVFSYPSHYTEESAYKYLFLYLTLLVYSSAAFMLIGAIPALAMGAFFSVLRLKKCSLTYFMIFIISGVIMFFWTFWIFGFEKISLPDCFSKVQPLLLNNLPAKALVLSACVSLGVAVSTLPER